LSRAHGLSETTLSAECPVFAGNLLKVRCNKSEWSQCPRDSGERAGVVRIESAPLFENFTTYCVRKSLNIIHCSKTTADVGLNDFVKLQKLTPSLTNNMKTIYGAQK